MATKWKNAKILFKESELHGFRNNTTWIYDTYVDYSGVPQLTAEYYDDRNCFIYGMHILEWAEEQPKLIEVESTDNTNWITDFFTAADMAMDGVMPESVFDLLGKKTYEDLGFTDSYLSSLKNRADSFENDTMHLSNCGNGVDYVELYKSNDGRHFLLNIYGGPYILKIASHDPNKLITYFSIEGIR